MQRLKRDSDEAKWGWSYSAISKGVSGPKADSNLGCEQIWGYLWGYPENHIGIMAINTDHTGWYAVPITKATLAVVFLFGRVAGWSGDRARGHMGSTNRQGEWSVLSEAKLRAP